MQVYDITPMGKPRMTQRDKWAKRKCVSNYWSFKDELKLSGMTLPEQYHVVAVLPMPQSWSNKKKRQHLAKPHQQKPDRDNIDKAITDALYKDDAHLWDGRVSKLWGYQGFILVSTCNTPGVLDCAKQIIQEQQAA